MPLPQQVVEQLGREPPKTPGWSGQFLIFSGAIFFIVLSIYLGLAFGYEPYLHSQIKKLNDEVQSFGTQVPVQDQVRLIGFYSQIMNIQTLLANQVLGTRAFEWLEEHAHVRTYLKNLNVGYANNQLSFTVVARTMDDALEEIAYLQKRPEIKKLDIGAFSRSIDGWQFAIQIALDDKYFLRSRVSASSATSTTR